MVITVLIIQATVLFSALESRSVILEQNPTSVLVSQYQYSQRINSSCENGVISSFSIEEFFRDILFIRDTLKELRHEMVSRKYFNELQIKIKTDLNLTSHFRAHKHVLARPCHHWLHWNILKTPASTWPSSTPWSTSSSWSLTGAARSLWRRTSSQEYQTDRVPMDTLCGGYRVFKQGKKIFDHE